MTATLTRRAMFGGAGKVATFMALAAAPTVVSAALSGHPDADIIAALHRWRSAVLAYVASPLEVGNPIWEALLKVADDAMDEFIQLQPTTVEGLAIKAFMAMRFEYGSGPDDLLPDYGAGSMTDESIPRSMVADFLRLSPILAAAVG